MGMILPRLFMELKTVCRNVLAYTKSHTLSNKVSYNSDLLIIQLAKGKTSSKTLLPKFIIDSALFDSTCLNQKVTEAVYRRTHFRYRWKKQVKSFSLLPPALFLERGINEQIKSWALYSSFNLYEWKHWGNIPNTTFINGKYFILEFGCNSHNYLISSKLF